MIVSCGTCHKNMHLQETKKPQKSLQRYNSRYWCEGCNQTITIIDYPDENTNLIRALELKIRDLEMDAPEIEISDLSDAPKNLIGEDLALDLFAETELGKPRCQRIVGTDNQQCVRAKHEFSGISGINCRVE